MSEKSNQHEQEANLECKKKKNSERHESGVWQKQTPTALSELKEEVSQE